MSAREDLDLMIEAATLSDAFVTEKAKRGTPEFDEEAYRAAKQAMSEHRTHWRGIREYVTAVREQEWAAQQAEEG